jgi:hypothetical protein
MVRQGGAPLQPCGSKFAKRKASAAEVADTPQMTRRLKLGRPRLLHFADPYLSDLQLQFSATPAFNYSVL